MENIEIITLQRQRDFSRKMNATFEFIKQNFKGLCKAIFYISGPSVLIASVLLGSMIGDFFSVAVNSSMNPDIADNYFLSISFWLQIIVMMVCFLLSTVMTISTINNYIILYDEKKTNQIEVSEVWERVRRSFWMYVGTTFLFTLVFIALYIVMIPFSFLGLASEAFLFLTLLLVYAGIIYFAVSSSMTYFIRSYENRGFFDALSRSFKLIKGEWWATFGFAIVIYFIMSSLASLIIIPFYVYILVVVLHTAEQGFNAGVPKSIEYGLIVFFALYYMISIVLYMLPNISIAFQYFNLVEMKEARGLISQIDSIGQAAPEPKAEEEDF